MEPTAPTVQTVTLAKGRKVHAQDGVNGILCEPRTYHTLKPTDADITCDTCARRILRGLV